MGASAQWSARKIHATLMMHAINQAWILLLSTCNGLNTAHKVGLKWAPSVINLIQGHACALLAVGTCKLHACEDTQKQRWKEIESWSVIPLFVSCLCTCHHALELHCTSYQAQGSNRSLITHPLSLANHLLQTGIDKTIATTGSQSHQCGRTTCLEL